MFEVSGINEVLLVDLKRSKAAAVQQLDEGRKAGGPVTGEITGTLEPRAGAPDQIAVDSFARK